MGIENVNSVLERLGSTEGTTLAINREDDGKFQVTSMLWEAPKVILKDELLEIRNVALKYRDRIDRSKIPCLSYWSRDLEPDG